jgi:hypothetical protein
VGPIGLRTRCDVNSFAASRDGTRRSLLWDCGLAADSLVASGPLDSPTLCRGIESMPHEKKKIYCRQIRRTFGAWRSIKFLDALGRRSELDWTPSRSQLRPLGKLTGS